MDQRLFFPATERNRGPIGDLLKQLLPGSGAVLELASGSVSTPSAFSSAFPICAGKPAIRIQTIAPASTPGSSTRV